MTTPTSKVTGTPRPERVVAAVRELDPQIHTAYQALADAAWGGGALEPRFKALVRLAADSLVSGLVPEGITAHIESALGLGASVDEVIEVIELVSILGIHTATMTTPILLEEMAALGLPVPDASSARALEVREEFTRRRGYWSPLWEAVNAFSPEFLKAYLDYSAVPVERGALSPQERELVLVVANCATTHLNPEGVRIHIRNALRLGATGAQIMEVFQVLALMGFRTCITALPLLAVTVGSPAPSREDPSTGSHSSRPVRSSL